MSPRGYYPPAMAQDPISAPPGLKDAEKDAEKGFKIIMAERVS